MKKLYAIVILFTNQYGGYKTIGNYEVNINY